ncbi:sodium:solute symporter family protein [bacterium]|jgi:solute:Na+ symporter, SSS family|nr:sodium:solute symporter family protein [bacterium]MBT5014996.1 sodium:solute symporter family protein [bacterium]
MMNFYFVSIFTVLTIVYLYLGYVASKRISTLKDYFLAGKNLGLMSLVATLVATQLGSGTLLGIAQKSYEVGFYGIIYALGISLGFIILSMGFASRMQSLNVATTAELFETRYGSVTLKQIASILSIITLCGILIGQIVASREFIFGVFQSQSMGTEAIFLLFWVFIIAYTILGGLEAVVITDVFQLYYIIIVFSGIFVYALWQDPVSFFSSSNMMNVQAKFNITYSELATFLPTLIAPALFSLIEQDLAQRFFSARTKSIAASSAIISSVFMILFAVIPIYFGMQAKLLKLTIPAGSNPLIPSLQYYAGNFFFALLICGLIAAITSTADSLLCAVSSNVAQDFKLSFMGNKQSILRSQWITLVVGVSMLLLSYFINAGIIDILISSYSISISTLFVPLVICYFKSDVKKSAAWASVITGGLSQIFFWFYPIFLAEFYILGFALIAFIIGSYSEKNNKTAPINQS